MHIVILYINYPNNSFLGNLSKTRVITSNAMILRYFKVFAKFPSGNTEKICIGNPLIQYTILYIECYVISYEHQDIVSSCEHNPYIQKELKLEFIS